MFQTTNQEKNMHFPWTPNMLPLRVSQKGRALWLPRCCQLRVPAAESKSPTYLKGYPATDPAVRKYHLVIWLFNIAMENGPFIDGLPIDSMVIFHGKLLNNQRVSGS